VPKLSVRNLTGLVAVLLGVLAAPIAPAVARTEVFVLPPEPDDRFPLPGEIVVVGDNGQNKITVGFRPKSNAFLVKDAKARVTSPDCTDASKHRVRCEAGAGHRVRITGSKGADRLTITDSVRRGTDLSGGAGNDLLLGAAHNDDLLGGAGNDIHRGGGGHDLMGDTGSGDDGRDTFLGGDGSDFILADDGTRDKRIACGGGGSDTADVDRKEKSRVTGCEELNVTRG
jgi:hypothetical protein